MAPKFGKYSESVFKKVLELLDVDDNTTECAALRDMFKRVCAGGGTAAEKDRVNKLLMRVKN